MCYRAASRSTHAPFLWLQAVNGMIWTDIDLKSIKIGKIKENVGKSEAEMENAELKAKLDGLDEQHRKDIRYIKAEYQDQIKFLHERITFLTDELKAWQASHPIK